VNNCSPSTDELKLREDNADEIEIIIRMFSDCDYVFVTKIFLLRPTGIAQIDLIKTTLGEQP